MARRLRCLFVLPLVLLLAPAPAQASAPFAFEPAMESAATGHQVPLPLIQAIAYVNTRWEVIGKPSVDGGVGPFNLRPAWLDEAAKASGRPRVEIVYDPATNLDAGAALLAKLNPAGGDLKAWYGAVSQVEGEYVAAEVFDTLRTGATRTTSSGETIKLAAQPVGATPRASGPMSADYGPAAWVPASPSNYTAANRPSDYPVDLIVIHDIEGSYGSAIQHFQDPSAQSSAHYVVSDAGQLTQTVAEHDIAWHAGNWDYNTRAIGIEHEGYAWSCCWYTPAMYQTSAHLIASICSRWGVPINRNNVIGHNEVPDPNHPGQYGGAGNHTDPGPYWDWNYYMSLAQGYAAALPSPPHMVLDVTAVGEDSSANLTWSPARSCHAPISGYTVTVSPDNTVLNFPASATAATIPGLKNGTTYTFTVTANNSDGQSSLTSNQIIPGPITHRSFFNWYDSASPGMWNDNIHLVNPGATAASGFLALPGHPDLPFFIDAGAEDHFSWPGGVIGGPVSVNIQSGPAVLASQRVQYYDTFNEVLAKPAAEAAAVSYFTWYDRASAGMWNDNIHILNPGSAAASGTIAMPGVSAIAFSVGPGAEAHYTWPAGVIGGPVTVTASSPVLASQRVQYYQSFNEVPARTASDAAAELYFNWYDKASSGMWNDNIHVTNPGTAAVTGTIALPGAPTLSISVPAGGASYYSWPAGTIGGAVQIRTSAPVIASQRVSYGQTFNEVVARGPGAAAAISYFSWYDKASTGMWNDNLHLVNPGSDTSTGTITLPGQPAISFSIPAGGERYYSWPQGVIGGPVTVTVATGPPLIASQRVAYWQSFNEVMAAPPPTPAA
ncbi:MAG: hypothetical protein E6I70_10480 [Chloroflexi bacterium]|nr:MAG: hypothetical protein E6I70_10480 [Chloroflexota bacterium]